MKQRVNWTIEEKAIVRLEILQKNNIKIYGKKISKSSLVERIILEKTRDPIETLTLEKRELIKQINRIDQEIESFEGQKEERIE